MGSTYLSLHYHIVFSTKDRRPLIRDAWRAKMHEYLGGTVHGLGGIPEAIGGVADHCFGWWRCSGEPQMNANQHRWNERPDEDDLRSSAVKDPLGFPARMNICDYPRLSAVQ